MRTVLVVDDEFDLTSTLRAILEGEGYKVDVCTNGREALDCLRAARPDLVLLDVMMPVVDGYGVLRAMREAPDLKAVPVILMNAVAPTKKDEGAFQAFLRKPFDLHTLLDTVRKAAP